MLQHHDKRCDKMFITADWSLLGNSRVRKPTNQFQIAAKETMAEAFRLEVDGWDSEQDSTPLQDSVSENSSPGNEQSAKRRKLSLSLKRKATCTTVTEQFEFMDDTKSEALIKMFVPKNTEKSTQWALSTFLSWRDRRNACFSEQPENQVPPDLLICTDPVALCKWLTFFVAEVRKKDGTGYPPKMLYLLLTEILRHMCSRNSCPNFLDTQDPSFSSFHNALDNVLRDLRVMGIGAETRPTEAFSKDDEEKL